MKVTALFGLAILGSGSAAWSDAPQAASHSAVTQIRVNGDSSDAVLSDPNTGTNGFLNVSRDRVTDTSALDFSYVTPTTDPDIVILVQGAGEIPSWVFTTTSTTAQLNVVTAFPVIRCEIDLVTGEFSCADGDPVAFDLTWTQNGFTEVNEHVTRQETIGPLTVSFTGRFHQRSALVNGTWTGNVAVNMSGNLLDTGNVTVVREIALARR